jgi:hypothetical protein
MATRTAITGLRSTISKRAAAAGKTGPGVERAII